MTSRAVYSMLTLRNNKLKWRNAATKARH